MTLRPRTVALLVCLLVVTAGAAAATAAAQDDVDDEEPATENGPTVIESCTTIDEPGTYVLDDDLQVATDDDACVEIQSSDVVLSGDGNELRRDEANGEAIGVDVDGSEATLENVTVEDVAVANWTVGLRFESVTESVVTEFDASENDLHGIFLNESTDNELSEIDAIENGVEGIHLVDSDDTSVTDARVEQNGDDGVDIVRSDGVELSNVTAQENAAAGIDAIISDDMTIVDSHTSDNAQFGIVLRTVTESTIEGIVADDNGDGIYLGRSSGTDLQDVSASGNTNGIHLVRSSNNELRDVSVTDGDTGFRFAEAANVRIDGAVATNNSERAFVSTDGIGIVLASDLETDSATIDFEGVNAELRSVDEPPAAPDGQAPVAGHVEVTNVTAMLLWMNYDEAELTAADLDEDSIEMWRYEQEWEPFNGVSGVDTAQKQAFVRVTADGIYAPFAEEP